MSFLAEWFDPGLEVGTEKPKDIEHEECERLARQLAIVAAAGEIPRRIGADADSEELATDKRRSKRVAHVLRQSYLAWAGKHVNGLPNGDEISKEAAQLDWEAWGKEQEVWLTNRMHYIVTLVHKNNGDEKFAKSAVVRLRNEVSWLRYALR